MSKLYKGDPCCSLEDYFFGAATVGERGQVVIPAEARKKLGIHPGDHVLVMSHPHAAGLMLIKIDSMREFLSTFLEGLSGMENRLGPETSRGGGAHESTPAAEK